MNVASYLDKLQMTIKDLNLKLLTRRKFLTIYLPSFKIKAQLKNVERKQ